MQKIPGFYRLASRLKVLIKPAYTEKPTNKEEHNQLPPYANVSKGFRATEAEREIRLNLSRRFLSVSFYLSFISADSAFHLPRCRCLEKGWSLCTVLWRTIDVDAPYTIFDPRTWNFSKEIKRICLHRYSEFGNVSRRSIISLLWRPILCIIATDI